MSNRTALLAISWLFWGIGFYLFQPFLSIFLAKFIPPNRLGLFYFLAQVLSLIFPLAGKTLARRLGIIRTIMLGMSLSGLGLMILPLFHTFTEALISYVIYEFFYITLPAYYALMKREGENVITRIWAISATPSIIMPSIGGVLISYLGYAYLFIISGIFYILAGIPLARYYVIYDENMFNRSRKDDFPLLITAIIIPLALSSQFIYLVIKNLYNLSVEVVGFIASASEIFGTALTYLLSYTKPKTGLYISMITFSAQTLSFINPYFAIFFGAWEAIIPLSLGNQKTIDDFALAINMQILGWIIGYLIASVLANPNLSILISGLISILLIPLIKIKY